MKRPWWKMTRVAQAAMFSGLAVAPFAAYADPVTLIAYVASTLAAAAYAKTVFVAVMIVGKLYGAMDARRRRRHATADARNAHNSSLLARNVSALTSDPPWRIRYGRGIAGGDVIHILTSDKTAYRENGTTYTRPDAYKHLVVELAHHEVTAIHNTFLAGVSVGPLDGSGFPTGGEFVKTRLDSRVATIGGGGSVTVAQPVVGLVNATINSGVGSGESSNWQGLDLGTISLSGGNTIISGPAGAEVNYTVDGSFKSVQIHTHLGSTAQTVDAFLNALFPSEWDSTHRLRGAAYVVITLDLEDTRFQGGIPNPTFDVSGKKCFDPRTSTTVYTQNPAICIRDWLLSPWGYAIDAADIDDAAIIEAANACDVRASAAVQTAYTASATADASTDTLTFVSGPKSFKLGDGVRFTTTGTLPAPLAVVTTYYVIQSDTSQQTIKLATSLANAYAGTAINITSSGSGNHLCTLYDYATFDLSAAFSTNDSKENVLDEMADAMAGQAVNSGLWVVKAGAWSSPVMDLNEDDLAGVISIPHGDTDYGELYNGMRGLYVPIGQSTAIDYQSYQNTTFVAADGEPLWDNKNFPFTDRKFKVRNLCRIFTERNRNGQTIFFPAKLRAWPLQIGDRVRVSSAEYGLTLKEFLVIDWQFSIESAVGLTLVEDAAAVYDLADATTADPTQNTNLPNPWVVAALTISTVTSALFRQSDGSFIVHTTVTWGVSTDAYVLNGQGRVVVNWRRPGETVWRRVETTGDSTSLTFTGAKEGDILTIEVFAVNSNKEAGPPAYTSHVVPITQDPNTFSGVTLVAHGSNAGSILITSNRIIKTGSSGGWDAGVHSAAPLAGACEVSAVVPATDAARMIGLNSDPALDGSYTSIDYAIYAAGSGVLEIYESGAQVVAALSYVAGDRLSVRYTGAAVEYRKGTTLLRTVKASMGLTLSLDSSFNSVGGTLERITFTPLSVKAVEYRVSAYGTDAAGSLPSGVDGRLRHMDALTDEVTPDRSYMMARISRSTGLVTFSRKYDVFGVGAVGGFDAADLATDLNATNADSVVVVWSYDEPKTNRLTSALDTAMYRCGASRGTFGNEQAFKVRSAYILIGVGGCGTGNGFEAYRGDKDSDTNAWVQVGFQITQAGQLLVDGRQYTPEGQASLGNLLANSSFEVDSDANGMPDSWAGYENGTRGTVTYSVVAGGVAGSKAVRVSATNLGTAVNDQAGITQILDLTGLAGQPVALSIFAYGSGSGTPDARVYVDFYDGAAGTGTVVGTLSKQFDSPGATWQRLIGYATVPATAVSCRAYAWMEARTTSAGAASMDFDSAQFEVAVVATQYGPKGSEILAGAVTPPQQSVDARGLRRSATAASVTVTEVTHIPDGFGFKNELVADAQFTAAFNGKAVVTFTGNVSLSASAGTTEWIISNADVSYNGNDLQQTGPNPTAATYRRNVSNTVLFSLVAGNTYTFKVHASKNAGGETVSFDNMQLVVEVTYTG